MAFQAIACGYRISLSSISLVLALGALADYSQSYAERAVSEEKQSGSPSIETDVLELQGTESSCEHEGMMPKRAPDLGAEAGS